MHYIIGEAMDAAPSTTAKLARKCILVVDDHEDSAKTLARLLNLEGYVGHAVFTSSSALEAARVLRPYAVLLDLTLPDMDGEEVATAIRASDDLRSTILIAVSGHTLGVAALSYFDGYVLKPADTKSILSLIANAESNRALGASSIPA
jgi:CheY-like chemotaxis protein